MRLVREAALAQPRLQARLRAPDALVTFHGAAIAAADRAAAVAAVHANDVSADEDGDAAAGEDAVEEPLHAASDDRRAGKRSAPIEVAFS